jgi:predicted nucleotidyltransferase
MMIVATLTFRKAMSFTQKWKNYQRLAEAKEQTPFKSPAQIRYKDQRRRNDIYSTKGGHKNKKAGSPFTGKVKRAGTSKLRFEGIIDQQALNSFEINDTLEPEVWENDKIIPEVREALLKIANDFLIDLPFDLTPEDITLTGSLANFNWSKYSDVDLHIVLDFSQIDDNEELVAGFFRNLQTNWNNRHDILMKGYEVEIYFQDSREPHLSTGIYSIQNDDWVVKPEKESATIDYANIEKKAEDIVDRINHIEQMMADEEGDAILDAIDRLKTKIRNMRKSGLEGAGQYSVENLAFKVLRRSEELGRLSDLKAKAYDELMTIQD